MCDNRQNLGLKLQSVVDTTCLEAVHCSYSFTVTDVVDTKSHNPYALLYCRDGIYIL